MTVASLFIENTAFSNGLIVFGLILFITGLAHRIPSVDDWDKKIILYLNPILGGFSKGFIYLWHLGTTPVALVFIAMTFIISGQIGFLVTLVYAGVLIIEKLVKKLADRKRPFIALSKVTLSQPTQPRDQSFPSGDAMRVSFLAVIIPIVFNLHWMVLTSVCLLAAVICVNRIALGSHFLLDIIGGAGLGVLGAGCVLLMI
jgi:undecaprenyl-diphosphatase